MTGVAHRVLNVILAGCVAAAAAAAPAGAATEAVVYSFKGGSDGSYPQAELLNVGGTLYGTTLEGGAHGAGVVFSITQAGIEKILYSFKGGSDGANPASGLIDVGGVLYGTTSGGGTDEQGTVFSLTRTGVETVLHRFGGVNDGANPMATMLNVGETLYGTTPNGGAYLHGTTFSMTLAGVETVLHSFSGGSDGIIPIGALIDLSGTLYGTTYAGGTGVLACKGGCGTVFSMSLAGVETVLHSFEGGSDGAIPFAGLIDVGGILYGTTETGGTFADCRGGCGTIFSLTPAGVETVLHSFGGFPGGRVPLADLLAIGNKLYGTAADGGYPPSASDKGTVFTVTRSGIMKVLHSFISTSDGAYPNTAVIDFRGALYGTTPNGGTGYGTVFEVTP